MKWNMRHLCLIAILIAAASTIGYAQSPVITQPYNVTTATNDSSTIAVTNTFQSIWAANTASRGRASCAIQNKGATDPMYVYFGAIAGATIAKSIKLTTSIVLNCSVFGVALQDQVSITGTSGDAFFAAQQ